MRAADILSEKQCHRCTADSSAGVKPRPAPTGFSLTRVLIAARVAAASYSPACRIASCFFPSFSGDVLMNVVSLRCMSSSSECQDDVARLQVSAICMHVERRSRVDGILQYVGLHSDCAGLPLACTPYAVGSSVSELPAGSPRGWQGAASAESARLHWCTNSHKSALSLRERTPSEQY